MVISVRDPRTGQRHTFGRFEEGHCLRLTDLMPDKQAYDSLVLKADAPKGGICRVHGVESKAVLYRGVILTLLREIIDDLIATGNHFRLPTSGGARWRIVAKSRDETRLIARRDTYKFVDLQKSHGRIYELVMEYRAHGKQKRRLLRIDYARYQQLCALVQAGRAYDIK